VPRKPLVVPERRHGKRQQKAAARARAGGVSGRPRTSESPRLGGRRGLPSLPCAHMAGGPGGAAHTGGGAESNRRCNQAYTPPPRPRNASSRHETAVSPTVAREAGRPRDRRPGERTACQHGNGQQCRLRRRASALLVLDVSAVVVPRQVVATRRRAVPPVPGEGGTARLPSSSSPHESRRAMREGGAALCTGAEGASNWGLTARPLGGRRSSPGFRTWRGRG
jgi:hypothetical protein